VDEKAVRASGGEERSDQRDPERAESVPDLHRREWGGAELQKRDPLSAVGSGDFLLFKQFLLDRNIET
jgi:hypothetical protein